MILYFSATGNTEYIAMELAKRLDDDCINLLELVTLPFNPVWSKYKLRAKDFYSTDKCVSCGKCAKLCPLNNITLEAKKPVWGEACSHCMACIGNCPVEAIEYGNITQEKDKYNFGKYKHFANITSDN